jgi:hypothetical protein
MLNTDRVAKSPSDPAPSPFRTRWWLRGQVGGDHTRWPLVPEVQTPPTWSINMASLFQFSTSVYAMRQSSNLEKCVATDWFERLTEETGGPYHGVVLILIWRTLDWPTSLL